MAHEKDIDVLNDVTKTLIDSCMGYEKVCEIADDHRYAKEFQARAKKRTGLVADFQAQVRAFGGRPETDGGPAGAAHRALTEFAALFRDDEKAALRSVDDGEEHLIGRIENKLSEDGLDPATRGLLSRALADAREGERFADQAVD